MATVGSRLKHAMNAFFVKPEDQPTAYSYGPSSSSRPDRPRFRSTGERTIITSIYTRFAVDVSEVKIEHVKIDIDSGQYLETIQSYLNSCLNVEANIDQAGRHFRLDMALTLFQEGVIAVIPVDTTADPTKTSSWDVKTMRVGTIVQWWPQHVRVRAYNENTGQAEEVTLHKRNVAIVENPFYSVMNEPNSTLQRLLRKLSMLDQVDEISSSGKLDIIIQLPYVVKGEVKEAQAEKRRKEITDQLTNSTYGIAYTDGTEKITQLNRSVENNLLEQVKYLKEELLNELGVTAEILNGTADEAAMQSYVNRIVEPVMDAITEAIARTFITKTARTQGQTMMYFQPAFKLLPPAELAKIIDALSRNQIVTSNEIRPHLGLKPSKEPQANMLLNANMPTDKQVTGELPPDALAEEPDEIDPADAEEAKLVADMAAVGVK